MNYKIGVKISLLKKKKLVIIGTQRT